jgi:tetratricopeptide (TPR) repeat protein
MSKLFSTGLALAFAALLAVPALAQEPPRPPLPRNADPNDWEAYFDYGDANFKDHPRQAAAAFYWAGRLDPSRAEPLFARWAGFFAVDQGLWIEYLQENERIVNRADVIANDSLLLRAYRRNPFVHRGLESALYSMLGRRLRWSGANTAFMDYGQGKFDDAARGFGQIVRRNPGRNVRFRYWRALSFVGAGEADSAAVELSALLEVMRMVEEHEVGYYYESKALFEYALGLLHDARGRVPQAREAYERALVEDLSMYPARAALARQALRERRAGDAIEHLAQVVEIAPDDPMMHMEYANALMAGNRRDLAIAEYRRVIELEPYYADPYLRLGVALQNSGDRAGAIAAYRAYLERAPRKQAQDIRRAQDLIAQLQQPAG